MKKVSLKPSKAFPYFATQLQKLESFERAWEIFYKRSPEFADHKTIANRLNAPVYFAHPHSPWERGTNENTNRLLRQYFPKKTKAIYTAAYLADCRQKINTRPRKCLGFASPASRFFFELRGCTSKLNVPIARPNFEVPIIKRLVSNETTIYSAKWEVYDVL